MAQLALQQDLMDKLERAVFVRWADDRGDGVRADAIAVERTALTAELSLLFGPAIRLLVEAEILSVHVGENNSFPGIMAPVRNVAVDDEFGITLDVEPDYQDTVVWTD
jgi:hypothetical protein